MAGQQTSASEVGRQVASQPGAQPGRRPKTVLRGKWAMITGATAGIGHATAELLAEQGVSLILLGRREDRLIKLTQELKEKFTVEALPVVIDVSDRKKLEAKLTSLGPQLAKISILVNNAGLALGTTGLQDGSLDDWDAMIDTNIKGLLYVTRICLPHLLAQPVSHIVNIGSVAGRWTYPGGNVYCATKFAVRALSESLRLDLQGKPVRVTNLAPGMVETEFSQVRLKDEAKAKGVYKGVDALDAYDIAESLVWCLERPQHVNVQEILVFPTQQAGVGPSYTYRNS